MSLLPEPDEWGWWEDANQPWQSRSFVHTFEHFSGKEGRNLADQRATTEDIHRAGRLLMIEKGMKPVDYLQEVMEGTEKPTTMQMQAAIAILPYKNRKQPVALDGGLGDDGKPVPLNATVRFIAP